MREAYLLRKVENELRALNELYGYKEMLVDYLSEVNAYVRGANDVEIIKFLHDTQLYALRPDFTAGIIKEVALGDYYGQPLKLAYFGSVFRKNISFNEIYQAGVEILFAEKVLADIESLAHADRFLRALPVKKYILCIGTAQLVPELCQKLGLTESQCCQLKKHLLDRNFVTVKEILKSNLAPEDYQGIVRILTLRDNQEVIYLLEKHFPRVYHATGIADIAQQLGNNCILDLSLVKRLDYYTGIIYEAYVADCPYAVLSGGRYDNLAEQYGRQIPAVGFAVNLNILGAGND